MALRKFKAFPLKIPCVHTGEEVARVIDCFSFLPTRYVMGRREWKQGHVSPGKVHHQSSGQLLMGAMPIKCAINEKSHPPQRSSPEVMAEATKSKHQDPRQVWYTFIH